MRNMLRRFEKNKSMYADFERCVSEAQTMKADGSLQEIKDSNDLLCIRTENGLIPSHYADRPLLYEIFQTPSFKKKFFGAKNFAVFPDTLEPMIVYHGTPASIPEHQGLKPRIERRWMGNILGKKQSILNKIRSNLFNRELKNYGIWFASTAKETKDWAAAEDVSRADDTAFSIYPCFIRINNPYEINAEDGAYKSETADADQETDGQVICFSRANNDFHFMVNSSDQIMHIPPELFDIKNS